MKVKPGTTVNASSITKSYNGFTKNTVNSKSVTIAADGSTVVEIYYDRYYYLMNFDLARVLGEHAGTEFAPAHIRLPLALYLGIHT